MHYPGTYAAGCYNRLVSRVARREVENEDLVNLPKLAVPGLPRRGWPAAGAAEGGDSAVVRQASRDLRVAAGHNRTTNLKSPRFQGIAGLRLRRGVR
nr:hypothetical protein [Kribbella sp. VKM Ac-2527]